MGNFYTIVTEVIRDSKKADNLEDSIREFNKNPNYRDVNYNRIKISNEACYFSMTYKNYSSGFDEWLEINPYSNAIRCAFLDSDGNYGHHNDWVND